MADLQDLVYSLEVGVLRRWLIRSAVLLLMLLLAGYYLGAQFNGLSQPEAMDQAQIARQISQGEGFTTKFIRPVILKYETEKSSAGGVDLNSVPDLINPPLYPYLLAGAFKVTGVSFEVDKSKLMGYSSYRPEIIMGFLNILFFVAAMVIFYVWMSRSFDDRVAILASLLLVATDSIWQFVISGLNVPLLLLLICGLGAAFNEALRAEDEEQPGLSLVWLGVAAFLAGLAFMTRYSMLAIPLALVIISGFVFQRRYPALIISLAVPALVSLPWMLRNIQLSGNPFGYAWLQIFAFDSVLWRTFSDSISGFIGLKPLIKAVALGMGNQLENLGFYFGGFLLPGLFFISLLHVFRRGTLQNGRWFWLLATVLVLIFNAAVIKLANPQESLELNGLIVLAPAFAAFGAAYAYTMIDRMKLPSSILSIPIVIMIVGIQLVPMGIKVLQKNPPPYAYPPYFPPVLFFIKDWIEPDELQSADIPWATAWYCDRTSIWIPYKKKDFYAMNDFKFKISAMLFTPETSNRKMLTQIQTGEYVEWASLIKRTELKDLPLPFFTALPPNPQQDYLYFSDRVRWR